MTRNGDLLRALGWKRGTWRAEKDKHFAAQAQRDAQLRVRAERAAELVTAADRSRQEGDETIAAGLAEQAAELRRAGA
jgi:hypothetical protein